MRSRWSPSRVAAVLICLLALACGGARGPARTESFDLTFLDSRSFDQQLSNALAQDPVAVAVDFATPFSPNAIPERLDRWLYAISSRGGPVKVEPDPRLVKQRSFGADVVVALAMQVYAQVRTEMTYRPAADYGALVHVDPERDRVTRVLFLRLPPQTDR